MIWNLSALWRICKVKLHHWEVWQLNYKWNEIYWTRLSASRNFSVSEAVLSLPSSTKFFNIWFFFSYSSYTTALGQLTIMHSAHQSGFFFQFNSRINKTTIFFLSKRKKTQKVLSCNKVLQWVFRAWPFFFQKYLQYNSFVPQKAWK